MKFRKLLFLTLILLSFVSQSFSQTVLLQKIVPESAEISSIPKVDSQVELTSTANTISSASASVDSEFVWEGTIFQDQDVNQYFYGQIMSKNGSLQIWAINEDLQPVSITIRKQNPVKFIDKIKNYVLVKEIKNTTIEAQQQTAENITIETIIAYYVYELKNVGNDTDWLEATEQFVNPYVDDSSFALAKEYVLTGIIELDEKNQLLYVSMKGVLAQHYIVYKIDLHNNGSTLITIGWFKDQGQKIVGGNSKVLVDTSVCQFLIYPSDSNFSLFEQTQYAKKSCSDLTKLPVYKDSIEVIDFMGSFFFFSSLSQDQLQLNGFLYSGYSDNQVSGEVKLITQSFFSFLLDWYHILVVVGSGDILWVQVFYNETTKVHENYVLTLLKSVKNESDQKAILEDFRPAANIFYHQNQLFVLSSDKFLVYRNNESKIEKVHEKSLSTLSGSQPSTKADEGLTKTNSTVVKTDEVVITVNNQTVQVPQAPVSQEQSSSSQEPTNYGRLAPTIVDLFREMRDFFSK